MVCKKQNMWAVQYNNPAAFPPVIHVCEIFAKAGFEVLVLGVKGSDTQRLGFLTSKIAGIS